MESSGQVLPSQFSDTTETLDAVPVEQSSSQGCVGRACTLDVKNTDISARDANANVESDGNNTRSVLIDFKKGGQGSTPAVDNFLIKHIYDYNSFVLNAEENFSTQKSLHELCVLSDTLAQEHIDKLVKALTVVGETKLRELGFNTLSFCKCLHLEEINLTNVPVLQQVEIGGCHNIKKIHISECKDLQTVSLDNDASALQELTIFGDVRCNVLRSEQKDVLPAVAASEDKELWDLNACGSLERISISDNDTLKELKLGRHENLQRLALSKCCNLRDLDVGGCDKLETLELAGYTDPDKTLNLDSCQFLKSVEISNCNFAGLTWRESQWLKALNVRGCGNLDVDLKYSDIKKLTFDISDTSVNLTLGGLSVTEETLQKVIAKCSILQSLRLINCQKLEKLTLSQCGMLESLIVEDCENIQTLHLSMCSRLTELQLPSCKKLNMLSFSGCGALFGALDLKDYKSLEEIDISGCTDLEALELQGIRCLKKLSISGTKTLVDLTNAEGVGNLTIIAPDAPIDLILSYTSVTDSDVSRITQGCPALKLLRLNDCPKLEQPDFSACRELKVLELTGCERLQSFTLDQVPILRSLQLSNHQCLTSDTFPALSHLAELNCSGALITNTILTQVNEKCPRLQSITLTAHETPQDVVFPGFQNLETLQLQGDLPGNVTSLNLQGCKELQNVDFQGFDRLTTLVLTRTKVSEATINHLRDYCSELSSLTLAECKSPKKLDFSGLAKLERLDLTGCESEITSLNLNGCTSFNLSSLNFSEFTALKTLEIEIDRSVAALNLSHLPKCVILSGDKSHVTSLTLGEYPEWVNFNLREFTKLESLTMTIPKSQQTLDLSDLPRLKTITLTEKAAQLTTLNLSRTAISDGTVLELKESCPNLQTLQINECQQLQNPDLSEWNLQSLKLDNNSQLQSVNVSGCSELDLHTLALSKYVILSGDEPKMTFLIPGKSLELTHFNLPEFTKLESLTMTIPGGHETLDFSDLPRLKTITLTGEVAELTTLYLNETAISDGTVLKLKESCPNLQTLQMVGCQQLQHPNFSEWNLQSLKLDNNLQLQSVNVSGCSELTSLTCTNCTNLQFLILRGCDKLKRKAIDLTGLSFWRRGWIWCQVSFWFFRNWFFSRKIK